MMIIMTLLMIMATVFFTGEANPSGYFSDEQPVQCTHGSWLLERSSYLSPWSLHQPWRVTSQRRTSHPIQQRYVECRWRYQKVGTHTALTTIKFYDILSISSLYICLFSIAYFTNAKSFITTLRLLQNHSHGPSALYLLLSNAEKYLYVSLQVVVLALESLWLECLCSWCLRHWCNTSTSALTPMFPSLTPRASLDSPSGLQSLGSTQSPDSKKTLYINIFQ